MSLKLNERYPGRFSNPTADYPQGSFKNRTTPDAKDGSYLEKDWANDKEGFFQSLLSAAGLVANGTVDSVGASQYYSALTTIIGSLAPAPPNASTTVKGIIEIATDPEVQAGADTQRAITPASLKAAYGLGDSTLVTDLNSAGQGYFYAAPGAANSPGSGIVLGETRGASGTAGKSQSCIDISTRVAYKRSYNGGSWSAWSSVIDSATLATETVTGVAKVATQALTNAGVDDATIVTPKKLRAGFSATFGASGYIAFPSWLGGLIVQWGIFGTVDTTIGAAEQTVNFPIAFPSNVFTAVSTPRSTQVNPTALIYSSIKALTLTQIQYTATVSGRTFIAIGN